MRKEFGCAVWKVSVDAGFSCPNVDGTVGIGGCVFCNTHSFAPGRRLTGQLPISQQIDDGIPQLRRRYKTARFIAYFQPSTNTYAPVEQLERIYRSTLEHPEILGLAIGTRPDALPDAVLDLLEHLSQEHWIQLEIGLQTIHRKSLDWLNRGHDYPIFLDAFKRARRRNLRLGVHVILGIPGENRQDIIATAEAIAALRPASVKLHNLHVVRETRLAKLWSLGKVPLPTLAEYAEMVVDFLERQSPVTVIERISGEADANYLLAPDWTGIKHAARNAVDQEFHRRKSRQGIYFRDTIPR